jgi:hypothetical protein
VTTGNGPWSTVPERERCRCDGVNTCGCPRHCYCGGMGSSICHCAARYADKGPAAPPVGGPRDDARMWTLTARLEDFDPKAVAELRQLIAAAIVPTSAPGAGERVQLVDVQQSAREAYARGRADAIAWAANRLRNTSARDPELTFAERLLLRGEARFLEEAGAHLPQGPHRG